MYFTARPKAMFADRIARLANSISHVRLSTGERQSLLPRLCILSLANSQCESSSLRMIHDAVNPVNASHESRRWVHEDALHRHVICCLTIKLGMNVIRSRLRCDLGSINFTFLWYTLSIKTILIFIAFSQLYSLYCIFERITSYWSIHYLNIFFLFCFL